MEVSNCHCFEDSTSENVSSDLDLHGNIEQNIPLYSHIAIPFFHCSTSMEDNSDLNLAFNDNFDISVDGITIPIGIALTPFESTALRLNGEVVNGESTIVNLNGDTSLLYVTIDNYKIPFYNKGNGWYPVFGIGEDGTLLVPEG